MARAAQEAVREEALTEAEDKLKKLGRSKERPSFFIFNIIKIQ